MCSARSSCWWRFEMKYVLLFGGTMEGADQLPEGQREAAMADYEKSGQWFEKYTKTGKIVGGFAVIDVADLDEAIAIAKEWPGTVEIRPTIDHSEDAAR